MSYRASPEAPTFRALIVSDYARLRPDARHSFVGAMAVPPLRTEMLASLFLCAQQTSTRKGHTSLAWLARTSGGVFTGADFAVAPPSDPR